MPNRRKQGTEPKIYDVYDLESRSHDIYERYCYGETLESIGRDYGITRERVRQILKVQVLKDLGIKERNARKYKQYINETVDGLVEQNRFARQSSKLRTQLDKAAQKGIKPEYFRSLHEFCEASNITASLLKEYEPEIFEALSIAAKNRWSRNYASCRNCGTTSVKHSRQGLCINCYPKSEDFKNTVKMSYQRHKESRSSHNKKYREEYFNRPDIKAREEQKYDDKYFGGNRKTALERDGYKCIVCGMSVDVKDKVGRPVVRVWHVNGDTEDHRLSNLKTYCRRCYIRDFGDPFRRNKTV